MTVRCVRAGLPFSIIVNIILTAFGPLGCISLFVIEFLYLRVLNSSQFLKADTAPPANLASNLRRRQIWCVQVIQMKAPCLTTACTEFMVYVSRPTTWAGRILSVSMLHRSALCNITASEQTENATKPNQTAGWTSNVLHMTLCQWSTPSCNERFAMAHGNLYNLQLKYLMSKLLCCHARVIHLSAWAGPILTKAFLCILYYACQSTTDAQYFALTISPANTIATKQKQMCCKNTARA